MVELGRGVGEDAWRRLGSSSSQRGVIARSVPPWRAAAGDHQNAAIAAGVGGGEEGGRRDRPRPGSARAGRAGRRSGRGRAAAAARSGGRDRPAAGSSRTGAARRGGGEPSRRAFGGAAGAAWREATSTAPSAAAAGASPTTGATRPARRFVITGRLGSRPGGPLSRGAVDERIRSGSARARRARASERCRRCARGR